jgi:hypothetical protein
MTGARPNPSRREFLKSAAATAALPCLDGLPIPAPAPKTQRVVLIAFAGGVRSKDTIETPQNVPNLTRIASQGVLMPNVWCENTGHYGAALSIFTGNTEVLGIRENERGMNPTLFEYLRKDAGFGAGDVWLSTSGGAQGRLFAHSDHPDFGVDYAANVLDGDGIFNVEFKRVLDSFGQPKADGEAERAALDRLGAALDPKELQSVRGKRPDPEQLRRVEKFILEELSGANSRITGPGAGDAKAIRIAASLLRAFRPKVLGITLQNHDIAHGSYNGYVEVIRRNDEEVGKLWDAIQGDPQLKETTSVLIVPEFGRDKDLNERNGLDHGDRSECLRKVFLIAAGPDFKKNKVVKDEARTIDVCPTVLSLFQKKPTWSKARVLKELLA